MTKFVLSLVLTCLVFQLHAQGKKDEARLRKEAELFFEAGQFPEAYPLYSNLVAIAPTNPDYQYHFGVCATFCDADKSNAIKYLKSALKTGYTEPLLYYFLGKALHLNYQFAEASNNYELFLDNASTELLNELDALHEIQMCIYSIRLMANPKELNVRKRVEADRMDFYRYMPLDAIGGKIVATPTELLSYKDKKNPEPHVIYSNGYSKKIFFSSWSDSTGMDIYEADVLAGGKFGTPTPVKGRVNTYYDEDYPVIADGGKTLYFASTGHNTMGGFDLFKSSYDSLSKKWKKPINMGFAYNSPDDDYLFIPDVNNEKAVFATGRTSDPYHLSLMEIEYLPRSLEVIYAKGRIVNQVNPENLNAQVTIKNLETGEIIADVPTNKNGEFEAFYPSTGKYSVSITANGQPTVVQNIVVQPALSGPVVFNQTMTLTKDGLSVKNGLDKSLMSAADPAVASLMRSKAQLIVIADDVDPSTLTKNLTNAPRIAGFKKGKSTQDILKDMQLEYDYVSTHQQDVATEVKQAYWLANKETKAANKEFAQADSIAKSIEAKFAANGNYRMTEADDKALERAKNLRMSAEAHRYQAEAALSMADKIKAYQNTMSATQAELNERIQVVQNAIKENNADAAIIALQAENKRLAKEKKNAVNPFKVFNNEFKASQESFTDIHLNYLDAKREVSNLEVQSKNEKKAKDPHLDQTIEELKEKRALVKKMEPQDERAFKEAARKQYARQIYGQMEQGLDLGLNEKDKVELTPQQIAQITTGVSALTPRADQPLAAQSMFSKANIPVTSDRDLNALASQAQQEFVAENKPLANTTKTTPVNNQSDIADNTAPKTTKTTVTPANTTEPKTTKTTVTPATTTEPKTTPAPKLDNATKTPPANPVATATGDLTPTSKDDSNTSLALKSAGVLRHVVDSANFREYDPAFAYEDLQLYTLLKKYPDMSAQFKNRARMDSVNRVIAQHEKSLLAETDPTKRQTLEMQLGTNQLIRSKIEIENKVIIEGVSRAELKAKKDPAMKLFYDNQTALKEEPMLNALVRTLMSKADSITKVAEQERKQASNIQDPIQKSMKLRSAWAKEMMAADMYEHMTKAMESLPIFQAYSNDEEKFLLTATGDEIRKRFTVVSVKVDQDVADNTPPNNTAVNPIAPENTNPNNPKRADEQVTTEMIMDLNSLNLGEVNFTTTPSAPSQSQVRYTPGERLNKPFFVKVDRSIYGPENPIPLDEPMPEGIVYSVQVGAFRKPIPQNTFNSFAPMMGQRLDNGFTRYMAGLFTNKKDAEAARAQIRAMGYKDAFVVVYKDGKRMNSLDTRKSSNTFEQEPQAAGINTNYLDNAPNALPAQPVEIDQSFFYTVQVGVFAKPAAKGQLKVGDLNTELLVNKMIRYSSRRFATKAEAQVYLKEVKGMGYADAFVTAYNRGKRVTITEADGIAGNSQPAPPALRNENNTENPIPVGVNPEANPATPNTDDQYVFKLSEIYGVYTCCGENSDICNNPNDKTKIKRITLLSNGSGVAIDGKNNTKNFKWTFVKDSPTPIQGMDEILGKDYSFFFEKGYIHLGDYCKAKD